MKELFTLYYHRRILFTDFFSQSLPYLREHQQEITDRIYRGKYTPSPVRRVEIPKADGGVRKFGIPTVVDRTRKTDKQRLCPFVRDCYI